MSDIVTALDPARPMALRDGASALKEAETRLATFKQFVMRVMTRGVDFAVIPGTPKPSLLKAGAERIAQLYSLSGEFEEAVVHEDWSAAPPFFSYRFRCRLRSRVTGEILGEGFGSANSRESKYAYRVEYWNDRKNPPPDGQGWEAFNGKFGKSFRRRVTNHDTADVANTVLKMAKKRAFVDAVLTVAAASEFFGQDLEDMPDERGHDDEAQVDAAATQAAAEPLLARVRAAQTITELQGVAQDILRQAKAVRDVIRPAYKARLALLRTGPPPAEAEAPAAAARPQPVAPAREPGDDDDEDFDGGAR